MSGAWTTLHLSAETVVIAALLAHQADRLWERGFAEAGDNYAPVFGRQMPPRLTAFAQIGALPAALALSLVPAGRVPALGAAALTLLWLWSIQRRLANHVWLGAVAVVACALLPQALDPVLAQDLLAGVYLSAALFKVNYEYLATDRSAGRLVTRFYLGLLRMPAPVPLIRILPVLVIAVEAAVGVSLVVPAWQQAGLVAAIAMHAAFGVSGNFTFSNVAVALWCCGLAGADGRVAAGMTPALAAVVVLGALAAAALGRSALGPRPRRTITREAFKGACFGALSAAALQAGPSREGHPAGTAWVGAACAAAFVLNLALVVSGVKLEWSFAMFTSLRPFGRTWLDGRCAARQPRYFSLTLPPSVPKGLLRSVKAEFIYEATRPEVVVHESVAHFLERAARRAQTTLAPRIVRADRELRRLVVAEDAAGGPEPERRMVLFPAIIPRDFDHHYLG